LIIKIHKRTLIILSVFLIVCFLVPISWNKEDSESAASIPTANWGLSFQEPGKTPVIDVPESLLRKYDGYFVGNEREKVLYLTFDAGYENGNTAKILDALKKHNVPATFFLVGNYINREPELVKRMVAEGHIVGNHTATHPDMSKIQSEKEFSAELDALNEKYKALIGEDMKKFYRPPQGKFSEENLKTAKKLGYKTIFWSLAYVDWYEDDQPPVESAMKTLTSRVHPGAIILLHSTSSTNAEIMDDILTEWKNMGYTFKSLEELP